MRVCLQAVQKPRSAARQWGAARGLVMLNIANWQKQRVRSSRMQAAPAKAPTWEDVILLVGVFVSENVAGLAGWPTALLSC